MNTTNIMKILKMNKIKTEIGLTEAEIRKIEDNYGICFTPDLKELFMHVLPISKGFMNWRDFSDENVNHIKKVLAWPMEGMIFDIENNEFWLDVWGSRPTDTDEARRICMEAFVMFPKLIPIYSHRYIPEDPREEGNPIFSVYQTDIIYYGENLESYFEIEFGQKSYGSIDYSAIKPIKFWREFVLS